MTMMKLHWSPKSPYVRKVMVCAHELGLVDRIELVRSVAAMLKPNARLMEDNPLSKIPTLVLADGFTLFDSVVMAAASPRWLPRQATRLPARHQRRGARPRPRPEPQQARQARTTLGAGVPRTLRSRSNAACSSACRQREPEGRHAGVPREAQAGVPRAMKPAPA